MSQATEEYKLEIRKIVSFYQRLKTLHPGHELLSLIKLHDNHKGFEYRAEFAEQCFADDNEDTIDGLRRYSSALESAVNGRQYTLPKNSNLRDGGLP